MDSINTTTNIPDFNIAFDHDHQYVNTRYSTINKPSGHVLESTTYPEIRNQKTLEDDRKSRSPTELTTKQRRLAEKQSNDMHQIYS